MELARCTLAACIEGTMEDTPAGCTAVSGFTYFTYPCLAIHWRLVEVEKGSLVCIPRCCVPGSAAPRARVVDTRSRGPAPVYSEMGLEHMACLQVRQVSFTGCLRL